MKEAFGVLRAGGTIGLADLILQKPLPTSAWSYLVVRLVCSVGHVPVENLVTEQQYIAQIYKAGYEDVVIERIEDEVFPGLLGFMEKQNRRFAELGIFGMAWRKLWVVRKVLQWLYNEKWVHFVVVRARKPWSSL